MSSTTYQLNLDRITVVDGPHRLLSTGMDFGSTGDVNPTVVGSVFSFGREPEPESYHFFPQATDYPVLPETSPA